MTRYKHWATFWMGGSFFSEDTAREVPERTVEAALAVAPDAAFAFQFYDTAICEFEFDASLFRVVPISLNKSAKHYMGGKVWTADELRARATAEGDPGKYRILIANVGSYVDGVFVEGHAVECRAGNWQPFEAGAVLVGV